VKILGMLPARHVEGADEVLDGVVGELAKARGETDAK